MLLEQDIVVLEFMKVTLATQIKGSAQKLNGNSEWNIILFNSEHLYSKM